MKEEPECFGNLILGYREHCEFCEFKDACEEIVAREFGQEGIDWDSLLED